MSNLLKTNYLLSEAECGNGPKRVYRRHKDRKGDAEYSAWFRAQKSVYHWLLNHSITTIPADFSDPFDLTTVDGVRIEVKASGMACSNVRKIPPYWTFNIHRHGFLREDAVDVYILRCEMPPALRDFFGVYAIHLVIPAPIGSKTLSITPRSLMTRWGHTFNNFSNIKRRAL